MMHVVLGDEFNTYFIDIGVTTNTSSWDFTRGISTLEAATSSDSSRYACNLDT